jgi:hypothetical protein
MELFNILAECGSETKIVIDDALPQAISTIINLLKIIIPVLVVLWGLVDLAKAVVASKEDDIKKSQGLLIKRLILAALVFFVVSLVQLVVSVFGGGTGPDGNPYSNCFDCFVNNECQ